jgi:hypothetical protein
MDKCGGTIMTMSHGIDRNVVCFGCFLHVSVAHKDALHVSGAGHRSHRDSYPHEMCVDHGMGLDAPLSISLHKVVHYLPLV